MYTAQGTTDKSSMLQQHSQLVKKIAGIMKAKLPANVEIDDLVQAGMIGLWDAINNFDSSHNTMFETYASQRIRGSMIDELRTGDWAPRSMRAQMRSVEQAIGHLTQKLSRIPKQSEVADYLGMSVEDYCDILGDNAGHQLVYLEDLTPGEDGSGFLERFNTDGDESPLSILMESSFRRELIAGIDELPEKEKLMMSLYYDEDLNLKEIGAVLGVSEARVSQIHSQAVARLRSKLGSK